MNGSKRKLDVYYKGRSVGTLAETVDHRIAFEYSDSWLADGFTISPFSLPLRSGLFLPSVDARRTGSGLYGVFADSLPDSWGELLLTRALQEAGINRPLSVIERLAYVGDSGMGALEYYPSESVQYKIGDLDYDEIARTCADILSSKAVENLEVLYRLGGSSGGSRPKILIADDDGEWIVKFPRSTDSPDIGKMEYDYSVCAKNCGINMPETALIPSGTCDGYFKTKRFDRSESGKVFTISAAALLEVDSQTQYRDYSDLMRLTNILTAENKYQIEQVFRLMCFNVFAHNYDDHLKNVSFLYDDMIWSLAPAYDLTYSMTYFMGHTTTVNGKSSNITDADLLAVGNSIGLSKKLCEQIICEVREKTEVLTGYNTWRQGKAVGKVPVKDRLEDLKEK